MADCIPSAIYFLPANYIKFNINLERKVQVLCFRWKDLVGRGGKERGGGGAAVPYPGGHFGKKHAEKVALVTLS